jgi:lysophospholipid acyltransferase (LPLAT)-like uncharacterized protein
MKRLTLNLPHLILQRLIWYFIKALFATIKFKIKNPEIEQKAKQMSPSNSFVFAVWHEQVVSVMRTLAWSSPYLALASRSKDGDYAAFVSKKLGYIPVRGSSKKRNKDKGGREAVQTYITQLKAGVSGGITVDGPKGPRQRCKVGVALIARQTGSPVVPVVGIPTKFWEFNSWDKFKIPKPFSTIYFEYGEPIKIESEASEERLEEYCLQIETSLKNLELKIRKEKGL